MTTEELIDGLGRLAKIMGKAEFRDWAAWCRNAAEDLLRRKEVVVVKHTKYYSRVTDISAFWGKELCEKEPPSEFELPLRGAAGSRLHTDNHRG